MMKKHLIVAIFLFLSNLALAQAPVRRSDVVETIDGKRYYIHLVAEQQTLFSLSQAYDVAIEELNAINPQLRDGLRIGQVLRIPEKTASETPVTATKSAATNPKVPDNPAKKPTHLVQQGETLYSISRRYQISVDQLLSMNPFLNEGLKTGQVLQITPNEQAPAKEFVITADTTVTFRFHQVKRRETVYGICRQYSITPRDLQKYNPHIANGIKPRQALKIPVYSITARTVEKTPEKKEPSPPAVTTKPANGKIPDPVQNGCSSPVDAPSRYNIAIMLPFYLNQAASMSQRNNFTTEELDTLWQFSFMQYYLGTRLALDSLEKQGLKANVYFYDVTQNLSSVDAALRKSEMNDVHLIIGPLHAQSFLRVSQFAQRQGIRIVNPLSDRVDFLSRNPYTFKAWPGFTNQGEAIGNMLKDIYPDRNLVLVTQGPDTESRLTESLRKALGGIAAKEIAYRNGGITALSAGLSTNKENIVVILSREKVFTIDLLRKLNTLRSTYSLQVVGLNEWENFELDPEHLVNLQVHFPSPHFVDYQADDTHRFISSFRKAYKAEPLSESYAMVGFDITYYFLSALQKYGPSFEECLQHHEYRYLQLPFHFSKTNGGGWQNSSLSIFKVQHYKEYLVYPPR